MSEQEIREKIKEIAQKIAVEFQPEKIILFGSFAWGKPGPDSDVDLLVVQKTSMSRLERAITIREKLRPFHVPVDLLVYTPEEIKEKIHKDRNLFIEDIVNNGQVIYAHH